MLYRCAEDLVGKFVQSNSVVGLGTGVLVSLSGCVPGDCLNSTWQCLQSMLLSVW